MENNINVEYNESKSSTSTVELNNSYSSSTVLSPESNEKKEDIDLNIFDDIKEVPKQEVVIKEVIKEVKVPVLIDGIDVEKIEHAIKYGFKTPKGIISSNKTILHLGYDAKTNQWYIQVIDGDFGEKYYLIKDYGKTWKVD